MKKTLLTVFMLVAFVASTFASQVVFDFTNPTALTPSITPSEEASTGVDLDGTPFTNGTFSFAVVVPEGKNAARIWTNSASKNLSKELRAYSGSTITITAAEPITSVEFKGKKISGMTATDGSFADGKWTGSNKTVNLSVTGTLNIETVTIVCGEVGPEPEPQPEENIIFAEAFKDGQGAFTIEDKVMPEGSEFIWHHSDYKGNAYMKASAFFGNATHASESWLVSPVIDLTKVTASILSFENAANKFNGASVAEACLVKVKAEGADWTNVNVENLPAGDSWNFVPSTVDLKAFDGKKIQIAFVYTSTDQAAGTWEINNVKLTGKGGEVKPEPQPEEKVYTTIAELKANAVRDAAAISFEFKDLTVIAKAKNDIYVSDGKEATLFYGSENTLNVGDKISGKVKGDLVSFFGLTEMKNVDYTGVTVVSNGNAVAPIVVTLEELVAEGAFSKYESQLVVVKCVKVANNAFDNQNIDMVNGDVKVTLRDNYKSAAEFTFDTNASYDITGVIGQFKNKVQINLLSVEGIQLSTGIEGVEAENGVQVIYDLSGRRVAKAVKGLYIINGKKVYVK